MPMAHILTATAYRYSFRFEQAAKQLANKGKSTLYPLFEGSVAIGGRVMILLFSNGVRNKLHLQFFAADALFAHFCPLSRLLTLLDCSVVTCLSYVSKSGLFFVYYNFYDR